MTSTRRGISATLSLLVAAAALLAAPHGAVAQAPHGATITGEVVEGEDFMVYDREGRPASFAHILAALDESDAVLVGESHDDVVGHDVEAQLLVRAAQRFGAMGPGTGDRQVILSLEMFERDVQYIVDEYLDGLITEDQFLESARPWDWYRTDYRPMVEFARAHGLPVVAANAPRRYINRVTRLGPASLQDLPEEARRYLPALPYPGPSGAYQEQWEEVMSGMMVPDDDPGEEEAPEDAPGADAATPEGHPPLDASAEEEEPPPAHGMSYALDAQALWDAAMGEAVARALDRHPGSLVLHYAGSFHVARGTGIPERLEDYRPQARALTVVLRPVEDIRAWDDEEHEGLADFVVLTRERSRPSPHGQDDGQDG